MSDEAEKLAKRMAEELRQQLADRETLDADYIEQTESLSDVRVDAVIDFVALAESILAKQSGEPGLIIEQAAPVDSEDMIWTPLTRSPPMQGYAGKHYELTPCEGPFKVKGKIEWPGGQPD